ncbi:MAG: methyltransferase, partial [Acidimicrobiales bacterium]
YQGLVVAFDFHRRGGAALAPDYVMGISASTLTLAGLTIRRPNAAALDIGTGSGFQALVAAQHSERVVATDRNPRAVAMASFNAALNGMPHMECREGDLFEPVEGEQFDLIVSNPPFIISPDHVYYFLHSGRTGDEVCRTIARDAGRFLRPGGYCQFLANWTVEAGQDWRDHVEPWFEGTGCDAWVLRRGSTPPDEYAAVWIETEEGDAGFARSFDAWMDYYRNLAVVAIDSGLVTMRRSTGAGAQWFRADDSPDAMSYPAGPDLAQAFESQDFLAAHTDDRALLAARFRLAPDVRLDQYLRPGLDAWDPEANQLRRTTGLHWAGGIDGDGADLLARCDGSRTMAELLEDLAGSLGTEAADVTPIWPAIVRRLVERGFLVPTVASM